MKFKDECIFNDETKEKIYNLYRESNLEAMEYAKKVLPMKDERMEEYLSRYNSADFENEDLKIDIFWEAMDYLGMTDYITQRESEI